jgi:pimeloyl-ACP methyl ester carboxylesterase
LAWAVRHPEQVRSLTLVEPTCFGLLDEASLGGDAGPALRGLRALTGRLSAGLVEPDDVAEYAERSAMAEPGEDARSHFRWPDWLTNRQALALEEILMSDGPTRAQLRMLAVPTVLVIGDRTAAHHRAVVDLLAELLPSAVEMELAGGHACHLEGLDRFRSILTA